MDAILPKNMTKVIDTPLSQLKPIMFGFLLALGWAHSAADPSGISVRSDGCDSYWELSSSEPIELQYQEAQQMYMLMFHES